MIREELRRLSTWGERHRRLLARVMIALALSLVVDAVGAGLVWYFEHGVKSGSIGHGRMLTWPPREVITNELRTTRFSRARRRAVDG